MMLDVGTRLGTYEILSRLSWAGAGEAYAARDHEQERGVIVRVIHAPDLARWLQFQREGRTALALAHPNVLAIYDIGLDAHAAYIVSEPLRGDMLRSLLDRDALSAGAAFRCALHVLRALVAGWRKGVRHNDLKPENILIAPDGRTVVLDFGLASVTRSGPPRSDLRAFGTIASELASVIRRRLFGRSATARQRRLAWALTSAMSVVIAVFAVAASGLKRQPEVLLKLDIASVSPIPDATLVRLKPDTALVRPKPDATLDSPTVRPKLDTTLVRLKPDTTAVLPTLNTRPVRPRADTALETAPAIVAPAAALPVPQDRVVSTATPGLAIGLAESGSNAAPSLSRQPPTTGTAGGDVASLYVRGLTDAREAFRRGGTAEALASVHAATASLAKISQGRPGSAEIARLVLQAAAAAAQTERDEMRLYLEVAMQMEALQHAAGQPGAPVVTAAEASGDLWLQVHEYEKAQHAYTEAVGRVGPTPRILTGLARSARGLKDVSGACAGYRRVIEAGGMRPDAAAEVAEARAYITSCPQP